MDLEIEQMGQVKNIKYCKKCVSLQHHLCELAQETFSDDYLTANPTLRKYIKSNPKGYIPFQVILQQPAIKSLLNKLKLSVQEQKIVLRQSIQNYGKTIFCSNKGIRRTIEYKNRCRSFKPLLIEHIKDDFTLAELRSKFGPRTNILNGKIMQFDKVNYIIVYAEDFRAFDRQQFKDDPHFSLFNYQQFWKQLQMQGSLLENQVKYQYNKSNQSIQKRKKKRKPIPNYMRMQNQGNYMRMQNQGQHDDSSSEDMRDRLYEESYHQEMERRITRGGNRQANEYMRQRQQPQQPKMQLSNSRLVACMEKCIQRERYPHPLHRKISSLDPPPTVN